MSNPVRFGQEFQGRIANPRDLLVFHRAKRLASRQNKVTVEEPELSIDDPSLTTDEKLAKVRVGTLVKEYLGAQDLQLLGEMGMSDAIQMFVEKDDVHAIQTHVNKVMKNMLKNVKTHGDLEDDDAIDEMVSSFLLFFVNGYSVFFSLAFQGEGSRRKRTSRESERNKVIEGKNSLLTL